MWGIELIVMAAMIGVNSLFAGYEIALASVSLSRLQRLADDGRRGASVAVYMKRNVEASLAVVQLGITLVGAIAAAVGGAGAEENLAPALAGALGVSDATAEVVAIALVVAPLTIVTIIVGELIPKVYALRNAERVCLKLSPFMRWFSRSVWPAVWMFESIVVAVMSWRERRLPSGVAIRSEMVVLQDLRATAAVARSSRLIGHREERIIVGATEMQSRTVQDIMFPADRMCMLDANASLTDNLMSARLDMHTRYPVAERAGDPQTVIGYVNFKDVVAAMQANAPEPSFRSIVRPVTLFPCDQTIATCLEILMREHSHIAMVRDADDRVVGMITLEDILEELVGEIEDEYDRLPSHILGSDSCWIVGGGLPLTRLTAATGIDLGGDAPAGGAHTLSDWVCGHLGRDVRGGDVVERGMVRVTVRRVRRNQVQEAQVIHAAQELPSKQSTPPIDGE